MEVAQILKNATSVAGIEVFQAAAALGLIGDDDAVVSAVGWTVELALLENVPADVTELPCPVEGVVVFVPNKSSLVQKKQCNQL